MGWIIRLLLVLFTGVQGYEQSKREGTWSWSKFAFALGFAAVAGALVSVPWIFMNTPAFVPVLVAAWVLFAALFVWFIIVCRRWKLPDGRTSLEADRAARRQNP